MIDRWIEQGKPLCGKNVDILLCSSTADLGVQITYFNKIADHYVLHLIIFYSGQTSLSLTNKPSQNASEFYMGFLI